MSPDCCQTGKPDDNDPAPGFKPPPTRKERRKAERARAKAEKKAQRIHPESENPTAPGWYECWAIDGRWNGEMRYRAWGHGYWWIPLKDGWITSRDGLYKWRGPVANVNGPAPDGTNPQPPDSVQAQQKGGER